MSRYTGPVNRKSRRLGFSILETGKELAKKPNIPGQHGKARQKKPSNYGIQLAEKQKVRFMYGLSEKQFKKTFNLAGKMKGVHGENLLKLLESRLDNLAYRIGFSNTRRGSRQLVNHGHILVNGKKVDIPSYSCSAGDIITLREKDFDLKIVNESLEAIHNRAPFVSYDEKKKAGTFVRMPERSELNNEINESLIVEFYNR
jgi:ribosomal protein S4, bacterial/organelle type